MGSREGVLSVINFLDLSQGVAGPYCAKLLAGLGADVIKVEPPGTGDTSRQSGPFLGNRPEPKSSALFSYLNTSKKSVTLDPGIPRQAEVLKRLAQDCDILVENYRGSVMDRLGLGYDAVSQANPQLIYLKISSQGATGPEANY